MNPNWANAISSCETLFSPASELLRNATQCFFRTIFSDSRNLQNEKEKNYSYKRSYSEWTQNLCLIRLQFTDLAIFFNISYQTNLLSLNRLIFLSISLFFFFIFSYLRLRYGRFKSNLTIEFSIWCSTILFYTHICYMVGFYWKNMYDTRVEYLGLSQTRNYSVRSSTQEYISGKINRLKYRHCTRSMIPWMSMNDEYPMDSPLIHIFVHRTLCQDS